MLHGTIRNDEFLAQNIVVMLAQCCNFSKQCRNNVATLCCAKNRHCEGSHITSPVVSQGPYYGDSSANVGQKVHSHCFKLLLPYPISFNLLIVQCRRISLELNSKRLFLS